MTANAGIPHLKHRDLKSCCTAVFLRLLNRRFTVNSNYIFDKCSGFAQDCHGTVLSAAFILSRLFSLQHRFSVLLY
jgi:hypothetical protein